MKSQELLDNPRTHVLVLASGEEVIERLMEFAQRERPACASFTAIGALQCCVLGFFDWERKEYIENRFDEQVELLSMAGNLFWVECKPTVNAQVVVGLRNGTTRGGHLLKAIVRPTLELTLVESPAHVVRRYDPDLQMSLIDPEG